MEKEIICISCPIGCRLKVTYDETNPSPENIKVENNKCPRGKEYGIEEILSPKRVVTATASIESKIQPRIPVKTTAPINKDLIFPLLKDIYTLKLKPPIKIGDKIIKNYKETGIDIVATFSLPE